MNTEINHTQLSFNSVIQEEGLPTREDYQRCLDGALVNVRQYLQDNAHATSSVALPERGQLGVTFHQESYLTREDVSVFLRYHDRQRHDPEHESQVVGRPVLNVVSNAPHEKDHRELAQKLRDLLREEVERYPI